MTDLPKTMCAVLLTGHGGYDKLEYRDDLPIPEPQTDEFLIRVGASAVNNTDINTRTSWYSETVTSGTTTAGGQSGFEEAVGTSTGWSGAPFSFPRIQGGDICGEIVAAGESANADRIGERVLVDHWFRDSDDPLNVEKTACIGSERDGGFAEYSAVPQECAHAINSDLSDEELASFPCAYSTAENMVSRPRVASEDTVLITGASGGVGSAAIQLCKRRGARVIALASEGKHKALKALGADVVLPREVDDLGVALSPHCVQGHVDVVLDTVSGPQFGNLIHQLRRAGRYASCGAIAGPIVTFDARDLIYNDLEFYGATVLLPGIFENLVQYIEQKEIQPVVSKVFSLADMRAAQEAFLSKTYVGKLVIRVRE